MMYRIIPEDLAQEIRRALERAQESEDELSDKEDRGRNTQAQDALVKLRHCASNVFFL